MKGPTVLLVGLAVVLLMLTSVALGVTLAFPAQILTTNQRPDQARFRLLSEDLLLSPGQTWIGGAKVWTVSDKPTGQCYTLFIVGSAVAASGPVTCPPQP